MRLLTAPLCRPAGGHPSAVSASKTLVSGFLLGPFPELASLVSQQKKSRRSPGKDRLCAKDAGLRDAPRGRWPPPPHSGVPQPGGPGGHCPASVWSPAQTQESRAHQAASSPPQLLPSRGLGSCVLLASGIQRGVEGYDDSPAPSTRQCQVYVFPCLSFCPEVKRGCRRCPCVLCPEPSSYPPPHSAPPPS